MGPIRRLVFRWARENHSREQTRRTYFVFLANFHEISICHLDYIERISEADGVERISGLHAGLLFAKPKAKRVTD